MKIPIHLKSKSFPLALITISALFFLSPSLFAQQKKTTKKPAPGFEVTKQEPAFQVGMLMEYFKLDHRKANKLMRQFASKAANAQELRDILGEMTEKDEAELVETGWLRGRSGQRVKSESIREIIFPTEYDPPEIPNNVGGIAGPEKKDKKKQAVANQQTQKLRNTEQPMTPAIHMTSATPTAYETRNVGLTIEIDPVIGKGNKIVDLNLAPEITTRLADRRFTRPGFEHSARGTENVSMATFYKMQTTTQITAIPGNYNLFAIHTPHDDPAKRIIVLLKVDLFRAK